MGDFVIKDVVCAHCPIITAEMISILPVISQVSNLDFIFLFSHLLQVVQIRPVERIRRPFELLNLKKRLVLLLGRTRLIELNYEGEG